MINVKFIDVQLPAESDARHIPDRSGGATHQNPDIGNASFFEHRSELTCDTAQVRIFLMYPVLEKH